MREGHSMPRLAWLWCLGLSLNVGFHLRLEVNCGAFSTHLQITITRNNGKGQWRVAGHVDDSSPLDCFEDGSDWKGPD